MSRPADDKPGLKVIRGDELPLSNASLLDLARSVLGRGFSLRFQAKGASMAPFIRDRDILTVAPKAGAGPLPGDIVACIHPADGKLCVHRIVALRGEKALVKGDNASAPDGALRESDILGFVRRVERDGRLVRFGIATGARFVAGLSRTKALGWLLSVMRAAVRVFPGRRRGR